MGIDTGRVCQQNEQLRSVGVLVVPESPAVSGECFWDAPPAPC